MIWGDQLTITRRGIYSARKGLETIGINPGTLVHMLPMRTFEYRSKEPGKFFPKDLLLTPIVPSLWPFVMRFVLRLRNRPGTLQDALSFFERQGINILFAEATRSGHHHSVLNVLAEVRTLEAARLRDLIQILKQWEEPRRRLYAKIYDHLYANAHTADRSTFQTASDGVWDFGNPRWFRSLIQPDGKGPDQWTYAKVSEVRQKTRPDREPAPVDDQGMFGQAAGYLLKTYGPAAPPSGRPFTIHDALEHEVALARPEIDRIELKLTNGDLTDEQAYNEIEDQVLPLRMLLMCVTTCKRVLCEKYKLLLIHHAFESCRSKEAKEIPPRDVYLYNIHHYKSLLHYPYFSERAILHSTVGGQQWDKAWEEVREWLARLSSDRRREWELETRADLDPVVIGSVESLCHAYYHRAYEREVKTRAQEGVIPFPELPGPSLGFLTELLPDEKSTTVALASRCTDDLTMRLCPLPISSLRRFVDIRLPGYRRGCLETCASGGALELREQLKQLMDIEDRAEPAAGGNDGASCKGTSAGFMHLFTDAVRDVGRGLTAEQDEDLNILRIFNDTYQMENEAEAGAMSLLAQSTDAGFQTFPANFADRLNQSFQGKLLEGFTHITADPLEVRRLSGGRVFVSLPLEHPMTERWLECVDRVGKQMGFTEVRTIKEFTGPITAKVAACIRDSHAMIQILALPLEDAGTTRQFDSQASPLVWLHAEYLTAVANGLEIVRLVDRLSIDMKKLAIGRDHPCLTFASGSPPAEFEAMVRLAYEELRRNLGDRLGLV